MRRVSPWDEHPAAGSAAPGDPCPDLCDVLKTKSSVMPLKTPPPLHRKNLRLQTEVMEKTAGMSTSKKALAVRTSDYGR